MKLVFFRFIFEKILNSQEELNDANSISLNKFTVGCLMYGNIFSNFSLRYFKMREISILKFINKTFFSEMYQSKNPKLKLPNYK